MDVLSEVLQVVRLSGVIHFNAEFSAPWAIVSSEPAALCTRLRAESVTPFHVFVGGHCLVQLHRLDPIRIQAGDVIVMPRGDQHVMASDLSVPPVPTRDIYPGASSERIPLVKHGGGGEPARFICGFLYSDQRFGPLLDSLPLALCVRTRIDGLTLDTLGSDGWSAQRLSNLHEAGLWQSSLQYLVRETARRSPARRAQLRPLRGTTAGRAAALR